MPRLWFGLVWGPSKFSTKLTNSYGVRETSPPLPSNPRQTDPHTLPLRRWARPLLPSTSQIQGRCSGGGAFRPFLVLTQRGRGPPGARRSPPARHSRPAGQAPSAAMALQPRAGHRHGLAAVAAGQAALRTTTDGMQPQRLLRAQPLPNSRSGETSGPTARAPAPRGEAPLPAPQGTRGSGDLYPGLLESQAGCTPAPPWPKEMRKRQCRVTPRSRAARPPCPPPEAALPHQRAA